CSKCGIIDKSSRRHRGLYICKSCGWYIHADVNGAYNIVGKIDNSITGNKVVKQIAKQDIKQVSPPGSFVSTGSSDGVIPPKRLRLR
ncbi:MAG: zinc ribbon domain-containing protein, partial [Candidatus Kariarchaeaceae archaeon]